MEQYDSPHDDEDLLVRLLIKERSKIVAYIRSIVFNHHLAEDVYQNVAVIVLRKRHLVEGDDKLLNWVLGVARLEALTAMRKRRGSELVFDEQLLDLLDSNWKQYVEREATTEVEMRETLESCLKRLPKKSKNILRLRYMEGLTGEKLAEKLDMKLNTAYVTLSRVHKALKECVKSRYRTEH